MHTKERIIKTALHVFLEMGYERASMNEIASRAELTKGGIYHYFDSKEQLFREALSFITERMKKWSDSQFSSVISAKDLIQALFRSISSMNEAFSGIVGEAAEHHPYSFLEILINAARRDAGVRQEMEKIYARTRENMSKILLHAQEGGEIRDDIDCRVLAFQINALIEGTLLLNVLDETFDLRNTGDLIYRNMWRMIER